MVRFVFLGRLADVAGAGEMCVGAGALAQVLADLPGELAQALAGPKVRVAVNGALVGDVSALVLGAGDEVAFLPPVSGG